MHQFYPYFISFHVVFSVAFLLTAIFITIYSLRGWIKNKSYGRFENNLRNAFLILLYADLVLGIILYFFMQKPTGATTAEEAMEYAYLRFWAIQHFVNMVFIVIICTIGNLFIKKTSKPLRKHKYSFLYFGVSTVLILITVGIFLFRK